MGDGLRCLAHLPRAVTESERALPSVLEPLEIELHKMGLADERFVLRMTGCATAVRVPIMPTSA